MKNRKKGFSEDAKNEEKTKDEPSIQNESTEDEAIEDTLSEKVSDDKDTVYEPDDEEYDEYEEEYGEEEDEEAGETAKTRLRRYRGLDQLEKKDSVATEIVGKTVKRFRGFRIHMYKYVPPCPKCKSRITGRYVRMPALVSDRQYQERESLKGGEIVRFISKVPYKNCFCVDCSHEWHELVDTKWMSKAEIEEEIEARHTYEVYIEVLNEQTEEEKKRGNILKKLF